MKKWTVLKSEDVSPSKWFPVVRESVELANGTVIDDFFTAPFGEVAMILPVLKDGRFVMVKQYKHGTGEILIELPAGFRQADKSIEESALAELEEETGIKTSVNNLISLGKIANNPTKTKHITHGFLAKDLEFNSSQALETTEEIELITIEPRKVLEMITNGEIWVGDSVSFIMKTYLRFPELFK